MTTENDLDKPALPFPHIIGIEAISRVLDAAERKIKSGRFDALTDAEIQLRSEYVHPLEADGLRRKRAEAKKNPPPAPEPKAETPAVSRGAAVVATMKAATADRIKSAQGTDAIYSALGEWLERKKDHVAAPAWIVGVICRFIASANTKNIERNERLDNLTARLTALEHAYAGTAKRLDAMMFDAGVWQADAQYSRGALVSHKGHALVCQADETRDEPFTSKAWRLVVKRGRDGKDAR